MGNKDTVSHDYMSDNKHFADAFNFFCFEGEQVIDPDDLEADDAVEEAVLKKFDEIVTSKKIRDVIKRVTIKSDKNTTYAILGIENQSYIHYAMPVRNMLYDALNYDAQVACISKKHRKENEKVSGAEYISGFTNKDKLKPVITLVINWSKEKWDGTIKLSEMLEDVESRLLEHINDYEMKLIDPHTIMDFGAFHSELGDVLQFYQKAE